ncbi:CTP-dependent riboflavin kinase [Bacillus niameyensis]|uniref:CTP-dependent riboflavin kinase n=1 Tax=Bacillus niameyensis TaxID=1522308 RepID=UPI000A4A3DF4|nr:CTP-dependent riboflavin kinase [Bacillus niameyensis]
MSKGNKERNLIKLTGKVVSGLGNYSYWIEKYQSIYYEKTGMILFPGTLNVELNEPYNLPSNTIRLEKEEYGGTVSVSILPCKIFGMKSFILRTDGNANGTGDHPKTIIEIATDIKLRDKFNLKDGDLVEVVVI